MVCYPEIMKVTIYSTPGCVYCKKVKAYLTQKNIEYTDIDVSVNRAAAEEIVKRSGQMGVPQIDIDGQIVIGADIPKINQLLGI